MLDHVGLQVSDFTRAKVFYLRALAPLGYRVFREVDSPGRRGLGLAAGRVTDFWIYSDGRPPTTGLHVAFVAPDRATVDAFYRDALAAGGRDNGPPGERPQYSAGYYGAFVLDPDGHNIEAVCRLPI
jgi:catechol 2,3-dioxygenase-like lactoylglutathione lyase family enzyme